MEKGLKRSIARDTFLFGCDAEDALPSQFEKISVAEKSGADVFF